MFRRLAELFGGRQRIGIDQNRLRLDAAHEVFQPALWKIQTERHPAGAGLEDAEHRGIGVVILAGEDRDAVVGTDALGLEEMRELIGARFQLAIGDGLMFNILLAWVIPDFY